MRLPTVMAAIAILIPIAAWSQDRDEHRARCERLSDEISRVERNELGDKVAGDRHDVHEDHEHLDSLRDRYREERCDEILGRR
jgi:hypothetical protein